MAIITEYLDTSGVQIPINKIYEFSGVQYLFKFKYNSIRNFYTVQIYNLNDNVLLYSNKIVYGQNITDSILSPIQDRIIPLNIKVLKGLKGTVDIDENSLGTEIKLYTDIKSD